MLIVRLHHIADDDAATVIKEESGFLCKMAVGPHSD